MHQSSDDFHSWTACFVRLAPYTYEKLQNGQTVRIPQTNLSDRGRSARTTTKLAPCFDMRRRDDMPDEDVVITPCNYCRKHGKRCFYITVLPGLHRADDFRLEDSEDEEPEEDPSKVSTTPSDVRSEADSADERPGSTKKQSILRDVQRGCTTHWQVLTR